MSTPLVSIIVPIYNTEKFLGKCLNSVLNQTYSNWECICVNDGSPDNSALILEEYSAKDSRIRVLNRENAGVSAARNAGMDAIRGDFFIFIDSDDFIHPQLLEICVHQILRDSSDIVIYRWSRTHTRMTKFFSKLGLPEYNPRMKKYDIEKAASFVTGSIYKYVTDGSKDKLPGVPKEQTIRHCSVCRALYSSSVYGNIRFHTGTIYEDVLWWGEALLRTGKATINNLNLYHYYPNLGSYTRDVSKLHNRIACLERVIPMAENLYSDVDSDYKRKVWHERFIIPLKRKLEKWKIQAAEQ